MHKNVNEPTCIHLHDFNRAQKKIFSERKRKINNRKLNLHQRKLQQFPHKNMNNYQTTH